MTAKIMSCLDLSTDNCVHLLLCRLENYTQFLSLLLLGGLEHPVSQKKIVILHVSYLHIWRSGQ